MSSTTQAIRDRVAYLRSLPLLPGHLRRAVESAEQWLAEGALSRYANHDFDVLSRLG